MKGKLRREKLQNEGNNQMEILFHKLNLRTLDDWLQISERKIIKNGGKSLLSYKTSKSPSNNFQNLLQTQYPNFPWSFSSMKANTHQNKTKQLFQSHEKQQEFMTKIFYDLQLQNFGDFLKLSKKKIIRKGGYSLFTFYHHNYFHLLQNIFPNYPWDFVNKKNVNAKNIKLISLNNQKKILDLLFLKLNFRSLDDFLTISKSKIKFFNKEGENILAIYNNDLSLLFRSIYPNYPWQFDQLKIYSHEKFQKIENQRKFLEQFYYKYQLRSLDDFYLITKEKFIKEGGFSLISFYSKNLEKLFQEIFPNFPWEFRENNRQKINFNLIESQIHFLINLFKKLNLKSIEELKEISIRKWGKLNAKNLIKIYENDHEKMLRKIFPNFPWEFDGKLYENSIENQKKKMFFLFKKFGFKNLNDWTKIRKNFLRKNGGKKLLKNYSNDMQKLLTTIYPDHLFPFDHFPKNSIENQIFILKKIMKKFSIDKKEIFYRLPISFEKINLFKTLKLIFPNEKWNKKLFFYRSKRTNQRILFSQLQKIYLSHFLIENYHHPKISSNTAENSKKTLLEFDIFIPSLNLAFEYQGEHHYNYFPSPFNANLEYYQIHDQLKLKSSKLLDIHLVAIPYWWDLSIPSLYSSIRNLY